MGSSNYSKYLLIRVIYRMEALGRCQGGLSTAIGQEMGDEIVSVKWPMNGGPPGGGAVGTSEVLRRKGPVR